MDRNGHKKPSEALSINVHIEKPPEEPLPWWRRNMRVSITLAFAIGVSLVFAWAILKAHRIL